MAGEGKTRQDMILADLMCGPKTKEWLAEKYGVDTESIKKDVGKLSKTYDISRHKKGVGYTLTVPAESSARDNKVLRSVEDSYKTDFSKMLLLLILQKEGSVYNIDHLTRKYMEYIMPVHYDEHDLVGNEETEKYRNAVVNALGSLISAGIIEKTAENEYKLTKKAPVYVNLSEDEALDILDRLHAFGPSYSFSDKLQEIEKKLALVLGEEYREENRENFVVLGNRMNKKPEVEKWLDRLSELDYEHYALEIEYGDKGEIMIFRLGLVVYLSDRDMLYLIGKNEGAGFDYILNVMKIKNISIARGIKNDIFESPRYLRMAEEMFQISVDPLVHVKVEFQDFGNIGLKLENLLRKRKNATLYSCTDGKFEKGYIYEDDIRGLNDFARFLRKFGSSVYVREPEELRKTMVFSLNRTLEKYREEGLYE
ncbi:MAG: WYL domain-containing protein [Lachnospiraceae bacterium]|nr:WYL domain-containing protein [Lachnospiraceae bacterium]